MNNLYDCLHIDPEIDPDRNNKKTQKLNKQCTETLERLFKTLQPEQYDKLKNWSDSKSEEKQKKFHTLQQNGERDQNKIQRLERKIQGIKDRSQEKLNAETKRSQTKINQVETKMKQLEVKLKNTELRAETRVKQLEERLRHASQRAAQAELQLSQSSPSNNCNIYQLVVDTFNNPKFKEIRYQKKAEILGDISAIIYTHQNSGNKLKLIKRDIWKKYHSDKYKEAENETEKKEISQMIIELVEIMISLC